MPDRSPLDLDHATMQRLGHLVTDVVAGHISTLREQPAFVTASRAETERLIAGPPPETGTALEELLAALHVRVVPYHAREPHPGFMAYIPGCPTFPAVLGDWLATGFNFFAGVWPVAAGPNQLELTVLDWFRQWLGMPEGTSGLLTPGGSSATVNAVVAARHRVLRDDPDAIGKLTVYTSDQAHSSVARAAWIAGIARERVCVIPTDDEFRMRIDALAVSIREDRRAGLVPFLVAASAGTTNTGAVDPLRAVSDLCEREGLWLHVDAAYAGFAALTERGKAALDGIGRADTVTLDPHKWLFVPFECGCLLARDPHALADAFRIMPEYLKDVEQQGERVNFADWGEQLTRYARAFKVWLVVSHFGTAVLRDAIDAGLDRALLAERLVRTEPTLELLSPARFSIVCFRAHPPGMNDPAALDALNERINERVNEGGRFFISSTRLRGAFSLRVCPLGFRTTDDDVRDLIRTIVELAAAG